MLVCIVQYMPMITSGSSFVALRLLRVLRLLKLARAFPRLRAVVEALGDGMASAGWVFVLILLLNYILACVGMILFAGNDPFHFGSLLSAYYTVWRVETLDAWEEVMKINMYGCAVYPKGYPYLPSRLPCNQSHGLGYLAFAFFAFTVLFGGIILPTTIIGIIAISFERAWSKYSEEEIMKGILDMLIIKMEENMPEWWSNDRLKLIRHTFSELDAANNGYLPFNEVKAPLGARCATLR